MKKIYKEPVTTIEVQGIDLMLSKESDPNDDPIYGKDRKDDFENGSDENKGWTDGLW
jgi:hypothetical protein